MGAVLRMEESRRPDSSDLRKGPRPGTQAKMMLKFMPIWVQIPAERASQVGSKEVRKGFM